jgi:hypothetical protein
MKKLFVALFHARQQTHFWHLETKSYAEHKALNDFYDEILELTDGLIESYLGKNERLKFGDVKMNFTSYSHENMINYLKRLEKLIKTSREKISEEEDSDLISIVDDILALINKTLYLLTLK